MAWEEKEVAVFVDHHHGEEDLFILRIDAMSVVNVGIMLEIAIVTGVVVEVAGAGHTQDHAQGLAPAPGTVAPGHAVVRAAALVLDLPGIDLQKTGLLEIMIGHQRTGQDPETKVPRTGLAPGTMDAPVHPQTTLKVVPVPDLAQGAGVGIRRTGMGTPRTMLATSETVTPLFCECLLSCLCQSPLMFRCYAVWCVYYEILNCYVRTR